eukprot:4280428-Pyramimonas_sp.AAC.1
MQDNQLQEIVVRGRTTCRSAWFALFSYNTTRCVVVARYVRTTCRRAWFALFSYSTTRCVVVARYVRIAEM